MVLLHTDSFSSMHLGIAGVYSLILKVCQLKSSAGKDTAEKSREEAWSLQQLLSTVLLSQ